LEQDIPRAVHGRAKTVGREFDEHNVAANYHNVELLGRYDLSVGQDM